MRKQQNKFSEERLLKTASDVCALSVGDILVIGGGTVLQEIAGYKRLRNTSRDLDFITNENGLAELLNTYEFGVERGTIYTYADDVLIAFFHNHIRGYHIPDHIFENHIISKTSQGDVYMIQPELNIALKIRRGASKEENPHVYGKDGLDFATIVTGMYLRGDGFDTSVWRGYMESGVCNSCNLNEYTECMDVLEKGKVNLKKRYREPFDNVVSECRDAAQHFCER